MQCIIKLLTNCTIQYRYFYTVKVLGNSRSLARHQYNGILKYSMVIRIPVVNRLMNPLWH